MQRLKTSAVWILLALVALVIAPTAAGYAWAIAWLPGYAVVCHIDKVFGPSITADGYRIFLLNRDCDLDTAIEKIAVENGMDPGKLVAMYHGTYPKSKFSAEDVLELNVLQFSLRKFALPVTQREPCPPGQLCGPWARDIVTDILDNIVGRYGPYAQNSFFGAVNDGADAIANILRQGPIFQALVIAFYLVLAWLLKKLAGAGVKVVSEYLKETK